MKLLVFLIRPDVYEAMEKDTGIPEIEMTGIVEVEDEFGRVQSTVDENEFKRIVQSRTSMIKNPVVVSRTIEDTKTYEMTNSSEAYPLVVERI